MPQRGIGCWSIDTQPFGGTKASGTGREGGTWSFEVFLEPKNVCVSIDQHPIPRWGI